LELNDVNAIFGRIVRFSGFIYITACQFCALRYISGTASSRSDRPCHGAQISSHTSGDNNKKGRKQSRITNLPIQRPNNIIMSTNPPLRHKMHTPNPHPHLPRQINPILPRRLIRIRIIDHHGNTFLEACACGFEAFVAGLEKVLVDAYVEGGEVRVVEGRFAGAGGADEEDLWEGVRGGWAWFRGGGRDWSGWMDGVDGIRMSRAGQDRDG
jgi:hypothetical protein